ALADIAAHLAMPTSEPRTEPYRLSSFSLTDMMELGADIRRLRRDCTTAESFAEAVVRLLHERVVDDTGQPAFALARFFELRPFAQRTTPPPPPARPPPPRHPRRHPLPRPAGNARRSAGVEPPPQFRRPSGHPPGLPRGRGASAHDRPPDPLARLRGRGHPPA